MAAGQESLDRLLRRQRSLEEVIADLTQTKNALSHDLDTIQRWGTARLILVAALVPIKAIAAAFEAREVLQETKEAAEMYSNIRDRLNEVKQGATLRALIRTSAEAIKNELVRHLTKKGTEDAVNLIPVVNIFYGLATDSADLLSEANEASELGEVIQQQREKLDGLQQQIDQYITQLNALRSKISAWIEQAESLAKVA